MSSENVRRADVPGDHRAPQLVLQSDRIEDGHAALVGRKAHGLRLYHRAGLPVPRGFAVTTDVFRAFVQHNALGQRIAALSGRPASEEASAEIQAAFAAGRFPESGEAAILAEAARLAESVDGRAEGRALTFAVRSSGDHEDLEGMSFAGMYRSLLNVPREALLDSIKACYASLFAPRSLAYLAGAGVRAEDVAMGVLVQETIDAEASGTLFTADAVSGFSGNGTVEGVWGYGEGVVSGAITPTSWTVHKRTGRVIGRSIGDTGRAYGACAGGIALAETPAEKRDRFCLEESEVEWLFARATELTGSDGAPLDAPLDIEWVKSRAGKLYFLQARPLAVRERRAFVRYEVVAAPGAERLVRGTPITDKVVRGTARRAQNGEVPKGEDVILVAENLEPDWLPHLGGVRGIVVEGGGVTSHMSIILRERKIPALFGAKGAWERIPEGAAVTLVCAGEGAVWTGELSVKETAFDPAAVPKPKTRVCVVSSNIADIDTCLKLPLDGIGLMRLEFVIHEKIGVHPLALLDYDRGALGDDPALRAAIEERTRGYPVKREYYIQKLTEGICAFASRVVGRVINVRLPDFISDDYLALLGGARYAGRPDANPMMGFRGTSKLIDEENREAFIMDCEAFKRAFERHGFKDIRVLVPFCRTPDDGRRLRELFREHGPKDVRVGMMVEIPSNVMLGAKFSQIFDFFLVGPMDLTQFTYAADRTSPKNHAYASETEAVKEMVKCFLRNIEGRGTEVYIGGWPLFQYAAEYWPLLTNNKLHLVELPDRLVELFENVYELERREGARLKEGAALDRAGSPHAGEAHRGGHE